MRKNNAINSILKSFYSKTLYQDVRENWGFNIVGYLFFLVLIYTGLLAFNSHPIFYKMLNSTVQQIALQFPTGEIVDGKMSIEQKSPYKIKLAADPLDKKPEKLVMIFDMTNQLNAIDRNANVIFHSNGYYLVEKNKNNFSSTEFAPSSATKTDKMTLLHQASAYHFTPYPKTAHMYFSAKQAQKFANKLKLIVPIVFVIILGVFQFLFRLIQAIAYAFLVMIFSLCCKVRLTYGQAYRLSIMAMTPSFILITISTLFCQINHPWLMAFLIEIGYLFFAAYANRTRSTTITTTKERE